MTVGIWVLGDQLWQGQSALESCTDNKANTPVIMIESLSHVRERRYHQQKLVLVWSAMRHFAESLKAEGWQVSYAVAESFQVPLAAWLKQNKIDELRVMEPADRPFKILLNTLQIDCKLVQTPNNHFLWSTTEFEEWAASRKSLLMESFYREGRKRFNILMDGKKPVGEKWNFDKENRKPLKGKILPPAPLLFEPDKTTKDVMALVAAAAVETFGDMEDFAWGVTRQQALEVLDEFVTNRLQTFGPYQDAMVTGEDTLWHALLSPYLNLGLLQPMEVITAVEDA
ncbi:MAG: cryptochrome/photolyase family protein, partial [Cyanobacteria bacterium P01_D01_bin.105]